MIAGHAASVELSLARLCVDVAGLRVDRTKRASNLNQCAFPRSIRLSSSASRITDEGAPDANVIADRYT